MPEMDGFEVAAAIAKHPELARATVMMLSSSGDQSDQVRCAALSIAAYLTKPVYADVLLTAIERAIGVAPSAAAPGPARGRAGNLAMGAEGRRARILLVEDNVVNQRVAMGLLARRGHAVTVASDGYEALEQLERETFDVVLMDLQMPVMGGLEAALAIRERERATGGHVRIIAMTAHAMASDRERCLAAGMDGYLSKPVDPAALFAMVEQRASAVEAPPAAAGHQTFNEADLLDRLSGDRALMAEVIRLFLEDLPARRAAIDAAVTAGDAIALRAAAHGLRGASATVTATALADAAWALEDMAVKSHFEGAGIAQRRLWTEADTVALVLGGHAATAHGA